MNQHTRTLKTIDLVGQLLMVVGPLAYYNLGVRRDGYHMGNDPLEQLATILIALGSWQTLSFLVHLAFLRAPWIARGRKVYHVLYIIVIIVGLIALAPSQSGGHSSDDMMFAALIALAGLGPVMGIFYFIVTARELSKLGQLPPDLPEEG